jgi:hypothetical protein
MPPRKKITALPVQVSVPKTPDLFKHLAIQLTITDCEMLIALIQESGYNRYLIPVANKIASQMEEK